MLLEGLRSVSDMEAILSDVPRKHISDQLVSRYFNFAGISLRKLTRRSLNESDAIVTFCSHSACALFS